jgi:hypothetical protein
MVTSSQIVIQISGITNSAVNLASAEYYTLAYGALREMIGEDGYGL